MTIGLAAGASYFLRTFPFGDTIIGAMIGAAFNHPIAGAVTGMLVPSKREGGFAFLADIDPLGGVLPEGLPFAPADVAEPTTAPNGATT